MLRSTLSFSISLSRISPTRVRRSSGSKFSRSSCFSSTGICRLDAIVSESFAGSSTRVAGNDGVIVQATIYTDVDGIFTPTRGPCRRPGGSRPSVTKRCSKWPRPGRRCCSCAVWSKPAVRRADRRQIVVQQQGGELVNDEPRDRTGGRHGAGDHLRRRARPE